MGKIRWSETRPDRSDQQPCIVCDVVDGDCGDGGFVHCGRRWEIGLTWPGSTIGCRDEVLTGVCQATVEDLYVPGEYRRELSYRGACAGCGWAADDEHDCSNPALEDALDHVLPDWRRVPVVERLPHDPSRSQRERWFTQVGHLYEGLGLEARYTPANGGLIRTNRQNNGTRSHWSSYGFYDVCAGVIALIAPVAPVEQLGLF